MAVNFGWIMWVGVLTQAQDGRFRCQCRCDSAACPSCGRHGDGLGCARELLQGGSLAGALSAVLRGDRV
jgi:hypothetical protein